MENEGNISPDELVTMLHGHFNLLTCLYFFLVFWQLLCIRIFKNNPIYIYLIPTLILKFQCHNSFSYTPFFSYPYICVCAHEEISRKYISHLFISFLFFHLSNLTHQSDNIPLPFSQQCNIKIHQKSTFLFFFFLLLFFFV